MTGLDLPVTVEIPAALGLECKSCAGIDNTSLIVDICLSLDAVKMHGACTCTVGAA